MVSLCRLRNVTAIRYSKDIKKAGDSYICPFFAYYALSRAQGLITYVHKVCASEIGTWIKFGIHSFFQTSHVGREKANIVSAEPGFDLLCFSFPIPLYIVFRP